MAEKTGDQMSTSSGPGSGQGIPNTTEETVDPARTGKQQDNTSIQEESATSKKKKKNRRAKGSGHKAKGPRNILRENDDPRIAARAREIMEQRIADQANRQAASVQNHTRTLTKALQELLAENGGHADEVLVARLMEQANNLPALQQEKNKGVISKATRLVGGSIVNARVEYEREVQTEKKAAVQAATQSALQIGSIAPLSVAPDPSSQPATVQPIPQISDKQKHNAILRLQNDGFKARPQTGNSMPPPSHPALQPAAKPTNDPNARLQSGDSRETGTSSPTFTSPASLKLTEPALAAYSAAENVLRKSLQPDVAMRDANGSFQDVDSGLVEQRLKAAWQHLPSNIRPEDHAILDMMPKEDRLAKTIEEELIVAFKSLLAVRIGKDGAIDPQLIDLAITQVANLFDRDHRTHVVDAALVGDSKKKFEDINRRQLRFDDPVFHRYIIPIQSGGHWSLVAIDKKIQQAWLFNSLTAYHKSHAKIAEILCLKILQPIEEWIVTQVPCPEQPDGESCGAYVLRNIHAALAGVNSSTAVPHFGVTPQYLRFEYVSLLAERNPNYALLFKGYLRKYETLHQVAISRGKTEVARWTDLLVSSPNLLTYEGHQIIRETQRILWRQAAKALSLPNLPRLVTPSSVRVNHTDSEEGGEMTSPESLSELVKKLQRKLARNTTRLGDTDNDLASQSLPLPPDKNGKQPLRDTTSISSRTPISIEKTFNSRKMFDNLRSSVQPELLMPTSSVLEGRVSQLPDHTREWLTCQPITKVVVAYRTSPKGADLSSRVPARTAQTMQQLTDLFEIEGFEDSPTASIYSDSTRAGSDFPSPGNLGGVKGKVADDGDIEFARELWTIGIGKTILIVFKGIEGGRLEPRAWSNLYYAYSHVRIICAIEERIDRAINKEAWLKTRTPRYLVVPLIKIVEQLNGSDGGSEAKTFVDELRKSYVGRRVMPTEQPPGRNGDRERQLARFLLGVLKCVKEGCDFISFNTDCGKRSYVKHALYAHPDTVTRKLACPWPGCLCMIEFKDIAELHDHVCAHMDALGGLGEELHRLYLEETQHITESRSQDTKKYPHNCSIIGCSTSHKSAEALVTHMKVFHGDILEQWLRDSFPQLFVDHRDHQAFVLKTPLATDEDNDDETMAFTQSMFKAQKSKKRKERDGDEREEEGRAVRRWRLSVPQGGKAKQTFVRKVVARFGLSRISVNAKDIAQIEKHVRLWNTPLAKKYGKLE